jgi:hypothetical protein
MATPRKPGATRGRPRKNLLHDPDRNPIAFALALRMLGVPEKRAFRMASVFVLGRKVEERQVQARRKRGVGMIQAGTMITFDRIQRAGMVSASFKNFAKTLSTKAKRITDPMEVIWLTTRQFEIASVLRAASENGRSIEMLMPELLSPVTSFAPSYDQQQEVTTMIYESLSVPRRAVPFMSSPMLPITVLIDQGEIAKLIQLTPEILGASHERVVHELAEAIAGFIKERT